MLRFAVLRDRRWGPVGQVAHGAHWFLNWADFPSVVPIGDRFWVAHWQVAHPGGQSWDYDIALAVSRDAGATWQLPRTPHRDGIGAEHGFVSIVPVGAAAGLIWLDGRDQTHSIPKGKREERPGTFALRFASVARDGSIGLESIVDPDVCTCCQTSAVATHDAVVAAWRGHTGEDVRDNRVARRIAGAWSPARPLGAEGWHLNAWPVNGPALSARGEDVAAIWFSGEGAKPKVRMAISSDAGLHFSAPIDIDTADPVGRVGVTWSDAGEAAVSWIGRRQGDGLHSASLELRRISINGHLGPVETLATVGSGYDSGFPQITADGGCALLA